MSAFGPHIAADSADALGCLRTEAGSSPELTTSVGSSRMTISEAVDLALEATSATTPAQVPARANPLTNPLTRREMEVAELVAEGLSNRVIAEKLVVWRRTVDGHVERVLNKLGVGSRTQVVVWRRARG